METRNDELKIALISEVFFGDDAEARLGDRLSQAASQGAQLAVLPEIPLNPWSPATKIRNTEDAEPPGGLRSQRLSRAAREAGIGVVGGAIVRDPATGVRNNTALCFNADGDLVSAHCKQHIPEEVGFWETSHYDAGTRPLEVCRDFGMPFGLQICSDINRPQGSLILSAMGAEAVIAPRATELVTYPRWQVVFRAIALTACTWVVSVNRPDPEQGVLIGGPSVVVNPNGEIVLETTERLAFSTLTRSAVAQARPAYPGYLPVRADVYSREWARIAAGLRNEDSPG